MPSYSIALLTHADTVTSEQVELFDAYRRILPFATIWLYVRELDDGVRAALQKRDIMIRHYHVSNRFRLLRRMFTEVDADVFALADPMQVSAEETAAMIHQLVENRKDMVIASHATSQSETEAGYRTMCQALYGHDIRTPLSPWRVFSRRFIKSFAAFERGFPVELEWTIHALELDIPVLQYEADWKDSRYEAPQKSTRYSLNRFILNLQSRPLKWFGAATAFCLLGLLGYAGLAGAHLMEYDTSPLSLTEAAVGAGMFAILSFLSALSGLALHSISYQRRELKRLHFQQHSTL
jgi:hypothetical protein